MNKSEIAEIKKRFTKSKCSASRLEGCYVAGAEREIKTYIDRSFLEIDSEEQFKYLDIMKKCMSGTLGKNMLLLPFETKEEMNGNMWKSLMALRDSELKSPEMLEAFYSKIIETYDYPGNYLILLVYDAYDVPKKSEDGTDLGESEETYKYILCAICSVELSEAGLSYFEDRNIIANRVRDWVVEAPMNGFVFPAFTDRSADVHSLLYYVKNTDEVHNELVDAVLGCKPGLPSDKQREEFHRVIDTVINEAPEYETFEVVKNINDSLLEIIEDRDEPVMLDCESVKKIFKNSGIKEEHLPAVEEAFKTNVKDGSLEAAGLVEKSNLRLKTAQVSLRVKPENAEVIEIRVIDGRKCLVIPLDVDMEVNGIMRRVKEELESEEISSDC